MDTEQRQGPMAFLLSTAEPADEAPANSLSWEESFGGQVWKMQETDGFFVLEGGWAWSGPGPTPSVGESCRQAQSEQFGL